MEGACILQHKVTNESMCPDLEHIEQCVRERFDLEFDVLVHLAEQTDSLIFDHMTPTVL